MLRFSDNDFREIVGRSKRVTPGPALQHLDIWENLEIGCLHPATSFGNDKFIA